MSVKRNVIFLQAFKSPFFSIVFLFSLIFITAVLFADRGWYEPDGVAVLAGSANLDLAKNGDFYLHGYFVQPLTYELNHLFYRLFKNGRFLYVLPPFFGSLGVCFLVLALYFFSERKISIFSGFFIILLFPEILFRLLYPNSSVFAMICFATALMLLFSLTNRREIVCMATESESSLRRSGLFITSACGRCVLLLGIGFLGALACMFRFDFIFGLPLLFFIIWIKNNSQRALWFCFLGALLLFALCSLAGLFNAFEIMRYHKFHVAFLNSLLWTNKQTLAVLMGTANIVVWIILIGYAVIYCWYILRTRRYFWLLGVIAVLVLLYPLQSGFNSVHYILPALCFAPFALVQAAKSLSEKTRAWKKPVSFAAGIKILVLLSIFLQFFSIEADIRLPFLYVGPRASYVYTHDGRRFFGAYWRGYADVFLSQYSPYWDGALGLSHGLAEVITKAKKNFIIVAATEEQGNYLRALSVYTLPFFLQLQGYTLEYQERTMVLRSKDNTVVIKNMPYMQYVHFENNDGSGNLIVRIPLISHWAPDFRKQLYLFYKETLTKACAG